MSDVHCFVPRGHREFTIDDVEKSKVEEEPSSPAPNDRKPFRNYRTLKYRTAGYLRYIA